MDEEKSCDSTRGHSHDWCKLLVLDAAGRSKKQLCETWACG